MTLKKENRSNYTPFHYWAEDYRHNNLKDLIDLWDLSEDERNELTCNLTILEGRIINFWIGRYLDPEAKHSPAFYLDAIVREILRFKYEDQQAYLKHYPSLRHISNEIEERLKTWKTEESFRRNDSEDYNDSFTYDLYEEGYSGGLIDAEKLFYRFELSDIQLYDIRSDLTTRFESFLEEELEEIEEAKELLEEHENDSEYTDDDEVDDAYDCIKEHVRNIEEEIISHYSLDFPEDLDQFEIPDDLRDEIMTRLYCNNWRTK